MYRLWSVALPLFPQWSVVSCPLSVVSCQTSWATDHGPRTTDKQLLLRGLLLDADRLAAAAAARARVRPRALAMHRHSLAMAQPAIAADVHQPLDIELNLAAQIAL